MKMLTLIRPASLNDRGPLNGRLGGEQDPWLWKEREFACCEIQGLFPLHVRGALTRILVGRATALGSPVCVAPMSLPVYPVENRKVADVAVDSRCRLFDKRVESVQPTQQ
jgi:hypothetical protein